MLKVKQLRVDRWFSYLVFDDQSRQALIVDPVRGLCDMFELIVDEEDLEVTAIVETQCHWHRASGAGKLHEAYDAPCLFAAVGEHPGAHATLRDGDELQLGHERLLVNEAPGVSQDALVLTARDFALTGNTLLLDGSGALGLPGSSATHLYESTRRIFDGLRDAVVLYPAQDCHGRLFSTVGHERHHSMELRTRDHDAFVGHKRTTPGVRPTRDMRAIWEANRARMADWDRDPVTGLPCSCLSPGAYLRDGSRPPCPETHARDALARLHAGAPLVDVREEFELLIGEVPGAMHIATSDLGQRYGELRPDETLILCAHGNRSAWAAHTLTRLGIPSTSVAGGLAAWREAGLEVA